MARTFKGYASAYSAHQVQPRMVRRQQIRNVVVDFNGAIDPARTIESVTWEAASPWITQMSNAAVSADQKSVSATILFNYSGYGDVKATITTDDGSQENYEFTFTVTNAPIYPSEVYSSANGPYSLTASSP